MKFLPYFLFLISTLVFAASNVVVKKAASGKETKAASGKETKAASGKETKAASGKETKAVLAAKVIHDSAMVYAQSNFDANVIEYLLVGDLVDLLSPNVVGPFYEIRTHNGKHGFISDIAIKVLGRAGKSKTTSKDGNLKDVHEKSSKTKSSKKYIRHILNGSFVGPQIARLEFREKAGDHMQKDILTMYGVKFFGRDLFIAGLVGELNFWLDTETPAYFKGLTHYAPASGYMFSIDTLMVSPFVSSSRFSFYSVFGPSLRYNRWQLLQKNAANQVVPSISQDYRLGIELGASLGFLLNRASLRFDWRLFIEKIPNNSLGASVDFLF